MTEAVVSGGARPRFERSIGIDLSASAVNTAAVELMWDGSRATIVKVWGAGRQPLDDECLVKLLDRSDAKIGVDCPFGWPAAFMDLVASQADDMNLGLSEPTRLGTPEDRQSLVLRTTDQRVITLTDELLGRKVRPLSVSADRIAHVAFRFAGLRTQLALNAGSPRDGSGPLVEVYPAAALALWRLRASGYKGEDAERRGRRGEIVEALTSGGAGDVATQIDAGVHLDAVIESDHVLDALVCALIARDCDLRGPQGLEGHQPEAKLEGWIHLPDGVPPAHESRA